ncbi:protein phosphatase 2C domain-containing protein [Haloarchaeobius sp. TZWWS8]|uniref:protein phosphatase 2C domain-containing protein n=1 Tax=Haloarchaeobius sp. TZWWS8 TaxID=3446121 RepID=UPI003EBF2030
MDAGVGVNEDVATVTNDAAWVLDGATGLTDDSHTPGATDATWYVRQVDSYLRQHVTDDAPLTEILRDCVSHVADEFDSLVDGEEVDPASEPSAAIAIARWTPDKVQYAVLGDASAIFRRGRDLDMEFGGGPRHLDEAALMELSRLQDEEGLTHDEAFDAIQPRLRAMRRSKNTLDGYWTLSFDPDAVDHARTGERTALSDVTLLTDGAEPLVEPYRVFKTWAEASAFILDRGPAAALYRLRQVERDDLACERYPRFKRHDDAAIAAVRFDPI